MSRIYFLIVLWLGCSPLFGQGVGEFSFLTGEFDENNYQLFIKAAREDHDSTKVVMLKSMYGKYLVHQQRYPEAEQELYQALDIIKKMEGELHYSIRLYSQSIYDAYDYLGEYYTQSGDYKKAEYFLKQSEQLRNLHFSRGSPHRIFNLQNIAEFYLNTGQTELSEAYLLKLNIELNRTRFNNEKLKSAYETYFTGMTEVCIRQGRLAEAKSFLKKTVKFYAGPFSSYRGALGSYGGMKPQTTFFRSQILMMEGNNEEALQVVESGITQNMDSLKGLPLLLQTKTICLYRLNRIDEALSTAQTLLDVHMHNINKVFNTLSESEKETMFNRTRDDFDIFNSLVIVSLLGNNVNAGYLESMLNFRLKTKALLLNNSMKIRQAIFMSGDSSLIRDYRNLSLLKNKASREVFRKSSKSEVAGYEEQIKVLEKSVSRRVSALAGAHEVQFTNHDIQKKLGLQDAAAEIIRVRKLGIFSRIKENNLPVYGLTDTIQYFSLILRQNQIDYALLKNGNDLEDRYFRLFKNQVQLDNSDTTLYHAFWSLIAKKTRGIKRLYFSGDGVYNQININLLQGADGYLEDQVEIVLLSNLKDIFQPENYMVRGNAVFFGQPNFQLSKPATASDTRRDVPNFQMEEMKETDFKDLPGTKIEITNGSKVLTAAGWKSHAFLGDDASENRLKSVLNPVLLHIATHGFFVEGSGLNPMLRSGLIFSGVKNTAEYLGEDGVLTAYEASSLALDSTRLVVLSACETGNGEVRTGEGVYGLQRAFLIAGAHNIIMSLWKIDDLATEKLMSLFYGNLATESNIRKAFVSAQRSLRKQYPEPFYWGAFILIGK